MTEYGIIFLIWFMWFMTGCVGIQFVDIRTVDKKSDMIKLKMGGKKIAILGDSITYNGGYIKVLNQLYKDKRTRFFNFGISGYTTDDILRDLRSNNLGKKGEAIKSYDQCILWIGANDIYNGKDSEYIFNNIKHIILFIENQGVYVRLVIGILPSGNYRRWNASIEWNRSEINRMLKREYGDRFAPVYEILQDKDDNNKLTEKYTNDGLHPNAKAHKLIGMYLFKILNK